MSFASSMEIVELDRSLAVDGEDFVLRRVVGTNSPINTDVFCRGFVRGYQPEELTVAIIQGDAKIILSPTQIVGGSWPGGAPPTGAAAALDRRVPRRGDKAVVQGRVLNIEAAAPIYIDNVLVRLELQVRG
jgi:hypothetical protein